MSSTSSLNPKEGHCKRHSLGNCLASILLARTNCMMGMRPWEQVTQGERRELRGLTHLSGWRCDICSQDWVSVSLKPQQKDQSRERLSSATSGSGCGWLSLSPALSTLGKCFPEHKIYIGLLQNILKSKKAQSGDGHLHTNPLGRGDQQFSFPLLLASRQGTFFLN